MPRGVELPEDVVARMREMREIDGLSNRQIGLQLGCARSVVNRYAKKLGWGSAKEGLPPTPVFENGEPCPGLAVCPKRSNLIARLLADLAARVHEYEARPHGPDTAEADAKLLGVFAQTLARLIDLDRDAGDKDDRKNDEEDGAGAVAELVRRLSRAAGRGGAGGVPEGSETP